MWHFKHLSYDNRTINYCPASLSLLFHSTDIVKVKAQEIWIPFSEKRHIDRIFVLNFRFTSSYVNRYNAESHTLRRNSYEVKGEMYMCMNL